MGAWEWNGDSWGLSLVASGYHLGTAAYGKTVDRESAEGPIGDTRRWLPLNWPSSPNGRHEHFGNGAHPGHRRGVERRGKDHRDAGAARGAAWSRAHRAGL